MTEVPADISIDERLAAEYRHARLRMRSLVDDVDDESTRGRRVPACPAWSVADLLAHVTGLAAGYGRGPVPDGDRQAWLDNLVTERGDMTLGDLVAEWDEVGPLMEQALAHQPNDAGRSCTS